MASYLQYTSRLSKALENEAHIKPTIFDILAQENMNILLRTGFNHIFKWVTNYIKILEKSKNYRDEIYLFIHCSVEFIYLKAFDSLCSENFYNMKRLNMKSNLKRVFSVVYAVIVPYLKAKSDNIYEDIERSTDNKTFENFRERLIFIFEKVMIKMYPYFNLIWHGLFLFYKFKFLINKSQYSSPFLKILNTQLVYSNNNNIVNTNIFTNVIAKLSNIFTGLIFMLQFYQWYENYSNNQLFDNSEITLSKRLGNDIKYGILDPPKLPLKLDRNKTLKALESSKLCPICLKSKKNESVLTVSGFVFCYPCIFKFVKKYDRCPLTNYQCTVRDITRIYDSAE